VQVHEGEGWRLVVDPLRQPFPVLIGGEHWASELAAAEALSLQEGVRRLLEQHRGLTDQLLEEEALTLELEVALAAEAGLAGAPGLWLELEGDRQHWSLRFVLTPAAGRRALEGGWPPAASAAFAAALLQGQALAALAAAAAETGQMTDTDQHC